MVKYKEGKIVTGYVTGIEKYGIFVTLDEYYTGLIHISEISEGFVRNVADYAEIGEIIKAEVIEYDENNRRLKLSIKNEDCSKKGKKNVPIKETETGFDSLLNELDGWIKNKEIEMSKK